MVENILYVSSVISSLMVIISFICFVFKPFREKIFKKIKGDQSERKGICALLRKEIISECKKAINQGYIFFYDLENLEDMFEQYGALGGNHGIENLVEQAKVLPVKMD